MALVLKDLLRAFYRLFYFHFWDSSDQIKSTVQQMFYQQFEIFLHGNNRNYNCNRFSHKFDFILFFVLSYKPKTRIRFSAIQWSGNEKFLLVTFGNFFYLQQVALYFNAMPNSIDFYKGIFLHAIQVRIIVPWLSV